MTRLQNACKSGRTLSWKLEENTKGTLIQLVWKHPQDICAELKVHTSGPVGSNLNNSKVVAGIPAAAGQPRKRSRRNNPSRLCRNARRLQHFLRRKSSSGNNPQPALTDSPSNVVSGQRTEWRAEADNLKDFIEKDVLC